MITELDAEITPPGSTLYYALCRVKEPQRTSYVGRFALHNELCDLIFSKSELVYVRLGWWHQELERLFSGEPRHPVTRAISVCDTYISPSLRDWVVNLEPFVGVSSFDDEEQLLRFCSLLSGPLFSPCARSLESANDSYTSETSNKMAIAFTLFGFIEKLGGYLRRGVLPIPRIDLERPGLSTVEMLRCIDRQTFHVTMERQLKRTQKALQDSLTDLVEPGETSQSIGRTITAIQMATLKEFRRGGCDTINKQIDITPLRKAWIAWKTNWRNH